MINVCTKKRTVYLFLYLALCYSLKAQDDQELDIQADENSQQVVSETENASPIVLTNQQVDDQTRLLLQQKKTRVRNIFVEKNELVSKESILVRLPFKEGEIFNPHKTALAIKNVFALGYFRQVQIYVDLINEEEIDLCIVVTEKPRVTDVIITGVKNLSDKDVKKETGLDKIQTINEEELKNFAAKIKRHYRKKNYHFAQVETELEVVDNQHVKAIFNVKENKKTFVKRIFFKGNNSVSSKKLKRIIYTREIWPMSPMDHSGSYQEDMINADKELIEDGYKSNGFLHATVNNIDVVFDEVSNSYDITYSITEGDIYFIKEVNMQGNDILSAEQLKAAIPIQPGQRYSQEKIRTSMERLRLLWGEYGYIFADIEPSFNFDEEEKSVTISFSFDLKEKMYLNRISIKGNKKARDKIIRRQILLEEGELITNKKMDQSRDRVKMMGFFDEREGVNWKTTRIDDTHADLDLMLKEIKTGKLNFQISYGGVARGGTTNTKGLVGSAIVSDRNLWGSGISASVVGELAQDQQSVSLALMNPWLFDKPLRGDFNTYYRRSRYNDGLGSTTSPIETVIGGYFGSGYLAKVLGETIFDGQLGFETINFNPKVSARGQLSNLDQLYYNAILNKTFQSGDQYWVRLNIIQDYRNGLVFTTNGYQWNWSSQLSFPLSNNGFNFFKTEVDATWYTPLIGENSLILALHGHLGFIKPINEGNIPWKSLFHIGGPTTVRGYTYGQVGPTWLGDSMGATKAMYINVELIIPLTPDLTTRAVVFYDGGSGWDMPNKTAIKASFDNLNSAPYTGDPNEKPKQYYLDEYLENDAFFYRHSFGVGIRMLNPTPLQVDFGIKLNPARKFKNKLTEVHLGMTHEF